MSDFITWLDSELSIRGWTDYKLAKTAGFNHSVISRARMGVLPRWEACAGIAKAFELPVDFVFRKAGLLSADSGSEDEVLAAFYPWLTRIGALSVASRERFLRQMDAVIAYEKEMEGEEDRSEIDS